MSTDEPLHGVHRHVGPQANQETSEHRHRGAERAEREAELRPQEQIVAEERPDDAPDASGQPRQRGRGVAAERDQRLRERQGEDERGAADREDPDVFGS